MPKIRFCVAGKSLIPYPPPRSTAPTGFPPSPRRLASPPLPGGCRGVGGSMAKVALETHRIGNRRCQYLFDRLCVTRSRHLSDWIRREWQLNFADIKRSVPEDPSSPTNSSDSIRRILHPPPTAKRTSRHTHAYGQADMRRHRRLSEGIDKNLTVT